MSVIVNIRGTHGSGKTTVSHRLMNEHECQHLLEPVTVQEKNFRKENAHVIGDLVIVGRYQSGCDGILPQTIIEELLWYWVERMPFVIWENVLVSGNFGRWGRLALAMKEAGHHPVWAVLDTPLQTCLDRVMDRRRRQREEGFKHRQRDEDVKIEPHMAHWRRCRRAAAQGVRAGLDVRWIDHTQSFEQVHDMLIRAGWQSPTCAAPHTPLTELRRWRPSEDELERLKKMALLPNEPDDTFIGLKKQRRDASAGGITAPSHRTESDEGSGGLLESTSAPESEPAGESATVALTTLDPLTDLGDAFEL